jgi:4-aminobutyrate aminotransferase-like enzyme
MVFAKGVANGFPLSGIVSRKELMDKQPVSRDPSERQVATYADS